MALEIKWGRTPKWSGRLVRGGKKIRVSLDVPVEGNPPLGRKLKGRGDAVFEKSRMKAELELERKTKELDLKTESGRHAGVSSPPFRAAILDVKLTTIYDRFEALPRRRPISLRSLVQAKSLLTRFVSFAQKNRPGVTQMRDIDVDLAELFMAHEAKRKVAPKTYNNHLVFLRGIFERLKKRAGMTENPFEEIPLLDLKEVGRIPFTLEELEAIVVAARKPEHALIRPVIFIGICTAMRRGDCCTLKWEDVNIDTDSIEVITSKTDTKVNIPLFPLLAEEIKSVMPSKTGYIFPELAVMYQTNPDGITYRVKSVLKDAGFFDAPTPPVGIHRGGLTAVRKVGLRAASVRGFHSFRVTWATVALVQDVPRELVRRVTGHQTVSVLLHSYFKPREDDFRRVLQEKMPKMFAIGTKKPAEVETTSSALARRLGTMSAENWESIRDRILADLNRDAVAEAAKITAVK